MSKQKILITGMSGLIGGIAQRQLGDNYTLTALNRRDVPGVNCIRGDIADLDAIRPAFVGQDMVIHLAAKAHGGHAWDDIHQCNVVGTYNVFEAAKQAGVQRVARHLQRLQLQATLDRQEHIGVGEAARIELVGAHASLVPGIPELAQAGVDRRERL